MLNPSVLKIVEPYSLIRVLGGAFYILILLFLINNMSISLNISITVREWQPPASGEP